MLGKIIRKKKPSRFKHIIIKLINSVIMILRRPKSSLKKKKARKFSLTVKTWDRNMRTYSKV